MGVNRPQKTISRRKFLAGVAVAGAALAVAPSASARRGAQPLLLISHRGAAKIYPENTVRACDWAVRAQGANAIEIDLCFSKDRHVLLWHDWSPNAADALAREAGLQPDSLYRPRVPPIGNVWRKPVDELTLTEIRDHFGYEKLVPRAYETDGAPPLAGEPIIPTLKDFVAWARRQPALRCVFLDIKMPCGDVARAASMLDRIYGDFYGARATQLTFKVVLLVADKDVLKAMIKHNRNRGYGMKFSSDVEIPLGVVIDPRRYSAIDRAVEFQLPVASVGRPTPLTLFPWSVYRAVIEYDVGRWKEMKEAARRRQGADIGMLVAWTINEPAEMQWLIEQGVSGILTDEIRKLREIAGATMRRH